MITTALAALTLLAPADTPIEPIDSAVILLVQATPEGVELCTQVGSIAGMIEVLSIVADDPELGDILNEMSVTYFAHRFENGYGPDAAMTQEAEEAFFDWVESCQS